MPEDKTTSNSSASSSSVDQPRVDTSALNEQRRQYDSPTVDLARPNAVPPPKEKLPAKPVSVASPPPPQAPPELPPQPASHNKHMLVYVLAGLLLLALIGGAMWWFMGRSDNSTPVVEPPVEAPAPEPPPMSVTVDTLETEETVPQLSGSVSDSAADVLVSVDGAEYVAVVDEMGNWQVAVDQPLEPGSYDVIVRAQTEDGREAEDSSTSELTILAAEPEPEPTPEPEPEPRPRPRPEPEQVPDTGPGSTLPNTGPGSSRPPR